MKSPPSCRQFYRIAGRPKLGLRLMKNDYYQKLALKLGNRNNCWWNRCKYLYSNKTNESNISSSHVNDEVTRRDKDKFKALN